MRFLVSYRCGDSECEGTVSISIMSSQADSESQQIREEVEKKDQVKDQKEMKIGSGLVESGEGGGLSVWCRKECITGEIH